jgi:sarcosine oxidase
MSHPLTRREFVAAAPALSIEGRTWDFAVIGAGVFGAWIARALHQAGRRVVLLDQHGPANNRASSGGETRVIRMAYGSREIYTRWSLRAMELYKRFFTRAGGSLFHRTGALWMARDGDTFTASTLPVFEKLRIPHEKLSRNELEKRYPQIDFGSVTSALYEPEAGALMARRAVETVVRETVKSGLRYEQTFLAPPPGGLKAIPAGVYIYACGPWLRKLFPEILGNRINPTRQEVFYFGVAPGDASFRSPALPVWVDLGEEYYGLPDIESRGFKIAPDRHGPTVDPDTQERLVPAASVERVREYLRRRFPRLAGAPLAQTEVCQYENTANGDYLIDRHPGYNNVWLVGGGSGHGYKHGPALGEYVAAALLKGAAIDPRFSLASKPPINPGEQRSTVRVAAVTKGSDGKA